MSRRRTEPGQESVWDYPRPPRLGATSHPPTYHIPPENIKMEHLTPVEEASLCEWKGRALYYDVSAGGRTELRAARYYPEPTSSFEDTKEYVAFYPSKMDACWVDGEKVEAQPGAFCGGWITPEIVGPFKGAPGTWGW